MNGKKIYEKPFMEIILLEAMEDVMSVSSGFRGDSLEDPTLNNNKKGLLGNDTFWGT